MASAIFQASERFADLARVAAAAGARVVAFPTLAIANDALAKVDAAAEALVELRTLLEKAGARRREERVTRRIES